MSISSNVAHQLTLHTSYGVLLLTRMVYVFQTSVNMSVPTATHPEPKKGCRNDDGRLAK